MMGRNQRLVYVVICEAARVIIKENNHRVVGAAISCGDSYFSD